MKKIILIIIFFSLLLIPITLPADNYKDELRRKQLERAAGIKEDWEVAFRDMQIEYDKRIKMLEEKINGLQLQVDSLNWKVNHLDRKTSK